MVPNGTPVGSNVNVIPDKTDVVWGVTMGVGGRALMTTLADAIEVHPVAFVTV